jgi:general secretion pathway protein G
MKRSSSLQAGFTLLEIMLVVAIIMLLLGTAIYKMMPMLDVGKQARVSSDIQSFKTGLMTYESLNGALPSTAQGLNALVTKPTGDPKPRNWTHQMDSIVLDPWGQPYVYENPGKHNPTGYDVYSCGPDHQPGTGDDIGNWEPAN